MNNARTLKKQFRQRVAQDLVDRSVPGMAAYLAIWSVIVFATGYRHSHPVLAYGALSGFLVGGLLRAAYHLGHKRLITRQPRLNDLLFALSVFLPAALWSGLFTYFFLFTADDQMKLLIVMATIGLCSGGATSYAPHRGLAAAYAGLITLPTCIGIIVYTPHEMVFLLLVVIYFTFTLMLLLRGHREYWSALENEAALADKTRQLEVISATDPLTGVFNRRHFNRMLAREWRRCSRDQNPLSLLILDLDHFKRINDAFGHAAGDAYLCAAAKAMQECFKRGSDVIARYGGEEFTALLPNTPASSARVMAEKLRHQIQALTVAHEGQRLQTTVSIGVAGTVPDFRLSGEILVHEADQALYLAKRSGRNRVC